MLDTVQFKKYEWQNRNRIRTAKGWQWLTVLVLQHFGQRIDGVLMNSTVTWKAQHLRALDMHYARAPYRNRYLAQLREIYSAPWNKLSDLNKATVQWLLEAFGIATPVHHASDYAARGEPTDRLIDLCQVVGATEYLAGPVLSIT